MAHGNERRHHPIRILHLLGCVALSGWFAGYAWEHHPARVADRARPSLRRPGATPSAMNLPEKLQGRILRVRSMLPDAFGGMAVLALFALGTGIYARRLEVWLEAHRAGEAAALRGLGLDQAALGANRDRKRGAVL